MERNFDLADMLVSYQRQEDNIAPTGTVELYYYKGIKDYVIVGDSLSVTASGPLYYCAPFVGGDLIIAGAWIPV